MKAYRDPYRLIAICNESSSAAWQSAPRGCGKRPCSLHVGCRGERNHSDPWQQHCYGVARWASKRCHPVRYSCKRASHMDGQDELCQGHRINCGAPSSKHHPGKQGNSRTNLLHKAHPNPKKKAEVFLSPWLIGLSPAVLRAARTAGDSPISPKAPSDTPPSTFLGIMYL